MTSFKFQFEAEVPGSLDLSGPETPAAIFIGKLMEAMRPLEKLHDPTGLADVSVWMRAKGGTCITGDILEQFGRYHPDVKCHDDPDDNPDDPEHGWRVMWVILSDGGKHITDEPSINFFSKDFEGNGDGATEKFRELFSLLVHYNYLVDVPNFDTTRVDRAMKAFMGQ